MKILLDTNIVVYRESILSNAGSVERKSPNKHKRFSIIKESN